MARVAVVGAGIAGLVLARGLAARHAVTVYEKSRGAGGRMATRYAGDFEFDHGAQFFTARSAAFREFLAPLERDGIVAPWRARFAELSGREITAMRTWDTAHPHYVGVPRMNVIGKTLAAGLDVRYATRVTAVRRTAARWELDIEDQAAGASADWLFVAVPLAQTRELLAGIQPLEAAIGDRRMLGCYSLMLGFDSPPDLGFDAALVRKAKVSWISVNSSKPGRGRLPTVVAHATNRWAEANMDLDAATVLDCLAAEVSRVTGFDVSVAAHKAVHRWRFANSARATNASHFLDTGLGLGVAGDWWIRGRVESAFTSAHALLSEFDSRSA